MKIEESEGEGYHKDISMIGTKWPASRVHTWAALMRQDANFTLYDKMVALHRRGISPMYQVLESVRSKAQLELLCIDTDTYEDKTVLKQCVPRRRLFV